MVVKVVVMWVDFTIQYKKHCDVSGLLDPTDQRELTKMICIKSRKPWRWTMTLKTSNHPSTWLDNFNPIRIIKKDYDVLGPLDKNASVYFWSYVYSNLLKNELCLKPADSLQSCVQWSMTVSSTYTTPEWVALVVPSERPLCKIVDL